MTSSCDRSDYYHISVPSCSNHGICKSGKCFCNSSWSSIGDYELNAYFDCDINIMVIRVLCIITLFLFLVNILLLFRGLSRIKFSWYHIGYDAKLTVFLCFLLDILGHSISAVAKAIDPIKYVIGASNGIVNIGNNIFMIFCCLGWCYYFQIFTTFIQGYSKMVDQKYRDVIIENSLLVDNFIIYAMIFPFICVICDDLCLLYPNLADKLAIGNLQGLLFLAGTLIIASEYSISVFINEIGKYLATSTNSNEQIKDIHKNISFIRYVVGLFFMIAVITCAIFSGWSYLRRKITYLHQIFHICMAILEGSLAYILTPKSTYSATSKSKQYVSISTVTMKSLQKSKKSIRSSITSIKNYCNQPSNKVTPITSASEIPVKSI